VLVNFVQRWLKQAADKTELLLPLPQVWLNLAVCHMVLACTEGSLSSFKSIALACCS